MLNKNCNAYPSHSKPSHTEHIDSIDIIANFSKDSLPKWVTLITILIENERVKQRKPQQLVLNNLNNWFTSLFLPSVINKLILNLCTICIYNYIQYLFEIYIRRTFIMLRMFIFATHLDVGDIWTIRLYCITTLIYWVINILAGLFGKPNSGCLYVKHPSRKIRPFRN